MALFSAIFPYISKKVPEMVGFNTIFGGEFDVLPPLYEKKLLPPIWRVTFNPPTQPVTNQQPGWSSGEAPSHLHPKQLQSPSRASSRFLRVPLRPLEAKKPP